MTDMNTKIRTYRVADPGFHPIDMEWLKNRDADGLLFVNEVNCYDLPSACLEIAASASNAVSVLDGAKIEGSALMVPEDWTYTVDDANKAYREWLKRFDMGACMERHLEPDRERDALLELKSRLFKSGCDVVEIEDSSDVYTGAGIIFIDWKDDEGRSPSLHVYGGAIDHWVTARFVAPGKLDFVFTAIDRRRHVERKRFNSIDDADWELWKICKGIVLERETNEIIERDDKVAGEWWELCFPDVKPEWRTHIECVQAVNDELVSASSWVDYSQRECTMTAYAITGDWEIIQGRPHERTVTVLDLYEGYSYGDDAAFFHRRFVIKGRLDRDMATRQAVQLLVSGVPREIDVDNR